MRSIYNIQHLQNNIDYNNYFFYTVIKIYFT